MVSRIETVRAKQVRSGDRILWAGDEVGVRRVRVDSARQLTFRFENGSSLTYKAGELVHRLMPDPGRYNLHGAALGRVDIVRVR